MAEKDSAEKEAESSEKNKGEEESGEEGSLNGSVDLFDDIEPAQDGSVAVLQKKLEE